MGLTRGFRIGILTLVLTVAAPAQEPPSTSIAAGGLLRSAPIEETTRARITSAVAARDYATAEQLLLEESVRQPQSQGILVALANILFLDGQHLNCAIALKKSEQLGPLDEKSRYLLALSYITIGKGAWAVPELQNLAGAHPTNANYPYWLARIAYKRMDLQAAVTYAKTAIQLDPTAVKAYDQLGLCYDALGDSGGASEAFQQAIHLNRKLAQGSPWPSLNLGILVLREGRLDEAEAAFREAISLNQSFPLAHFRLGQVLEKKGNLDDAINELTRAAKLDSTYPEPHYALGRIYRQKKNLAAAEKELAIFQDLRKADSEKGITRSN